MFLVKAANGHSREDIQQVVSKISYIPNKDEFKKIFDNIAKEVEYET